MPRFRMPILNFSTICTKLRPKNWTNLSVLTLLEIEKSSKLQLPFQKNRIGYKIRKNRRHFFCKPKTNCQKNENPQTDTDTKIKNPVIQRKNWKPDLKNDQNRKNRNDRLNIAEPPPITTLLFMCRQRRNLCRHVGRGKTSSLRLEHIWEVL